MFEGIELLKIGVTIQLVNLVSGELSKIAKQMVGLDAATIKAIKSMGAFKTAVVGIGAMTFGAGILDGLFKMAEAGSELEKQLALVKAQMADMSDADISNLKNIAIKTAMNSKTPITPSQVVEGYAENMTIFKDKNDAMAMLPETVKLKSAIAGVLGKTYEAADDDYKNLLKAADTHGDALKNGKDVGHLSAAMDDMERLMVSSRGMAKSDDIKAAYVQGTTVLSQMPYEAANKLIAGMIQIMPGSKVGTMLNAFAQQFYGGHMSQKNADEMEKVKLLGKGGYTKRKGGGIDVDVTKLAGWDLLKNGRVEEYLTQIMKPKMHDAYLKFGKNGETEKTFDLVKFATMIATSTDRRLMTEWLYNATALHREGEGIGKTQTPDKQNAGVMSTDIGKNVELLGSKFKTLFQTLGGPLVTPTIKILKEIGDGVDYLTSLATKHPRAAADLVLLAGGLAGVLVVAGSVAAIGGTLAVIAAIPVAGIVGIIGLIGVAIAGFAMIVDKYSVQIQAWVNKVDDAIIAGLTNVWSVLKDGFTHWFTNLGTWFTNMFQTRGQFNANQRSGVHQEAYRPNYGPNGQQPQHISIYMDGHEITHRVMTRAAYEMNGSNSGPTNYNTRSGFSTPGQII